MKKKKPEILPAIETRSSETALIDPEKFNKDLAAALPQWVKEVEDSGTAMYQAGQELLLVVDQVLERYYDFNEDKIKKFHSEVSDILNGAKEFEKAGLTIMTHHDVNILGEMHGSGELGEALKELAKIRELKLKLGRAGMEYPTLPESVPFLKRLKDKK